jgi:peptide chain release factor 1
MRILRARLLQIEQEKQLEQMAAERRSQVRTGDRSERIRTYNFPDNRVTDHRIGFTTHKLQEILEGGLDELVEALLAAERAEGLEG